MHLIARSFAEEFATQGRRRGDDQHRYALDQNFHSTASRSQKIPGLRGRLVDPNEGADRDARSGAEFLHGQRFIQLDAFGDLRGEASLSFRQVSRFLAVHVVLVFRPAFLVDRLVARSSRRTGLKRVVGAELEQDLVTNGGFLHEETRNVHCHDEPRSVVNELQRGGVAGQSSVDCDETDRESFGKPFDFSSVQRLTLCSHL